MCGYDHHRNHTEFSAEVPHERKIGFAAGFLLLLIKGYRYGVSPLFPPACRYMPTCSAYAAEAIARYGVFRGLRLTVCRLLRCHPFVAGGYDPVK